MNNISNWKSLLQTRGILDAALVVGWEGYQYQSRHNEWTGGGWKYPIYDPETERPYRSPQTGKPVYRWKNFDKHQGGPKYAWLGRERDCPPYYVLPGTQAAVATANGHCYIAAGEPDTLVFRSAGKTNVISWLNGECSLPDDLVEMCQRLNILHLHYFVDRDQAGNTSAASTARHLQDSPIAFTAYWLPDYQGDGGDINDLWKWCRFDPAVFEHELSQIAHNAANILLHQPANTPPEPATPLPSLSVHPTSTASARSRQNIDWNAERVEWIRAEVMPALDRQAPVAKREGTIERHHCPNPQHDDHNPSFRVSYDRDNEVGIPQCSCGIQYEKRPWELVAGWVGARDFRTWWREERKQLYARRKPQTARRPPRLQLERRGGQAGDDQSGTPPPDMPSTVSPSPAPLPTTDVGNARRFVSQYHHHLRYLPERDIWLVWNQHYWQEDWNNQVVQMAKATAEAIKAEAIAAVDDSLQKVLRDHCRSSQSQSRLKAMIALAESEPGIPIQVSALDANPWLFGCANGVIDLRTGQLQDGQPDDLITRHSLVAFDPTLLSQLRQRGLATLAPTFAAFLRDITDGSEDFQTFLQRAIGYTLTGDTSEQVYFLLFGTGSNGKTLFLELLARLMGDYATKAQFETFVRRTLESPRSHTSDIARLAGARYVYAMEGNEGRQLDVARINELTGGDRMTASFKYEGEFEFNPVLKLWLATNHKPVIRENTFGIWRRTWLVPFTHTIPAHKRDKHLFSKLMTEIEVVLAWAVQGCLDWQQQGLAIPAEVKAATAAFRDEQDSVLQFVQDCCEPGTSVPVNASDLWNAYQDFTRHQGLVPLSRPQFYNRLAQEDGVTRAKKRNQEVFYGIALLADESAA